MRRTVTTREYDKDGKLVKEVITETIDETGGQPCHPVVPVWIAPQFVPGYWPPYEITCSNSATEASNT